MRLGDDYDEGRRGLSPAVIVGGMSFALLFILAIVILTNSNTKQNKNYQPPQASSAPSQDTATESETSVKPAEHKLRAEDLDFWEMYPEEGSGDAALEEQKKKPQKEKTEKIDADSEKKETEDASEGDTADLSDEPEDPSDGGKKTKITHADGSEEWILLNASLRQNDLADTGFQKENGIMKYYANGKCVSSFGIDISQKTTSVSYDRLKSQSVDFVMVRIGARGYDSGKITEDERFEEHVKGLKEAGVPFGVYFYSQAISQEEISQEVNFILQTLTKYEVKPTYPVAIDMELVINDHARIEGVSKADRTHLIGTFCDAVKAAGYSPAIYGDKTWLLTEMDLGAVSQYNVWLSRDGDLPDYPYTMGMWQYETEGKISGIVGDYGMNISFIDYSAR